MTWHHPWGDRDVSGRISWGVRVSLAPSEWRAAASRCGRGMTSARTNKIRVLGSPHRTPSLSQKTKRGSNRIQTAPQSVRLSSEPAGDFGRAAAMGISRLAMNVIQRSKLSHVEFTFAVGDIFDASVDAIVSSEQTDFVLSGNPESLSGQIRRRYGEAAQRELDAATKGQVLGPGSVIETSGGSEFKRIFHAGFHDPDDWPDLSGAVLDATGLTDAPRELRETKLLCGNRLVHHADSRRASSSQLLVAR